MSSSKNVKYNIKSNEATTIGSQEAARGVRGQLSDHYTMHALTRPTIPAGREIEEGACEIKSVSKSGKCP